MTIISYTTRTPMNSDTENTQHPSTQSLHIDVPDNREQEIVIHENKPKAKNVVPTPSIDIAMLHMNISYTLISVLVEELYTGVLSILNERQENDSLYGRLLRILTLVVASVEQVSKTKTVLSGLQKKDLATAVTRALIEKCLENNNDLKAIYNAIIRDQVDDMIEILINVSRKVNSDGIQGNNGIRLNDKKKKGCLEQFLMICGGGQ